MLCHDDYSLIMRSRIWIGTIWDLEEIKLLNARWIIVGAPEQTEQGKTHWHAVVYFDNAKRSLRTGNSHWEVVNNLPAAIEYATKEGILWEKGERPLNTRDKQSWEGFVNHCIETPINQIIRGPYSKTYAKYTRFAHEVRSRFNKPEIIQTDPVNEWYYGEAGTGKTKKAWDDNPGLYVKAINKWWDGYDNEEVVLLDDWDKNHKVLVNYLKIWADRYPFRAELKGSSILIRPKKIIVTSNYSPEQCFENEEDVKAIRRRFKVTKFWNKLG